MYQGKKKEKSMIITSTVYVIVVYPVKMAILLENRKKHSKFINWSCSVTTFRIQICFFGHYFFSCLCNINFPFLFLCPWRHILYQSGLTLVSMYFFSLLRVKSQLFRSISNYPRARYWIQACQKCIYISLCETVLG